MTQYQEELDILRKALDGKGILLETPEPVALRNRFYAALKAYRRWLRQTGAPPEADEFRNITFRTTRAGLRVFQYTNLIEGLKPL